MTGESSRVRQFQVRTKGMPVTGTSSVLHPPATPPSLLQPFCICVLSLGLSKKQCARPRVPLATCLGKQSQP